MSYIEQTNCPYSHKNLYTKFDKLTNYSCDQPCICRFNEDRTPKDKMYYSWFVLNQPMNIPITNSNIPVPQNSYCNNKK
jgi:hypothetical protein